MSKYWDKRLRDMEITRLAKELPVEELAKRFNVSRRTILRVLREAQFSLQNTCGGEKWLK